MADTQGARRLRSGVKSGVNGTPTFFINGVRHDDAWDIETLMAGSHDHPPPQIPA